MAGQGAQTLQQVLRIGQRGVVADLVLTHNRHIPLLINAWKDVLKDSNIKGQIKAVFPGVAHSVPRTRQVFDMEVVAPVTQGGAKGLRVRGRFQRKVQEVFVLTDYNPEELQFVMDIAMGKYSHAERPKELDHLTLRRPAEETYYHPETPLHWAKYGGGGEAKEA